MRKKQQQPKKTPDRVRIDDLAEGQWLSPTRRTNGRRLSDREQRAIEAYHAGASFEGVAAVYGLPPAVLADILGFDRFMTDDEIARANAAVSAASDLLRNPIRSGYRRDRDDEVLSNPMRRAR